MPDLAAPAVAQGLDACDARGLPELGAGRRRGLEQEEVEMLAAERLTPFAKRASNRGHRRYAHGLAREDADALHLGAGEPAHLLKQTEFRKQGKRARRDEFAADFRPGESAFFDDCDFPASAGEHEPGGGACRAAADDDGVIAFGCVQHLCAVKPWESAAGPSCRDQPPRSGHRADSSRPRKPARTLAAASCRLTWLQPRTQISRLPRSGSAARRGSRATKSGASAADRARISASCGDSK